MRLGINGRFLAARLTGVQRFARGLCDALFARCDATVFLPSDAPGTDFPEHVQVVRGKWRGHVWEQLELPGMVRRARVEILLNPANTAPFSLRNHAIVVHDVLPLTHPHWFSRRYVLLHRHTIRRAIRHASHLFTSSEWSARAIVQACGIPRQRIHLVTQGLAPFDAPAARQDVDHVLAKHGIEPPYFLFVGLGDPRKNIDLLMGALTELHRDRNFSLVAIDNTARHIHGARSLVRPSWMHTLDSVSDTDLRALYTGALALCFPSYAEGFGRPPLEALACGTPALVGAYGAAHEVLGTSVPILPHEMSAWTVPLQRLLDDAGERDRLVRRGATTLGRFDWSRSAEQVLAALVGRMHERPADIDALPRVVA